MPSNLLAHRLRVLESEGLIRRVRSEGDKRPYYTQPVPDAFGGLTVGGWRSAVRVVFVCPANSSRSHLAPALWRHASDVPATSAGTHPAARIDPGALAAEQALRREHVVAASGLPTDAPSTRLDELHLAISQPSQAPARRVPSTAA